MNQSEYMLVSQYVTTVMMSQDVMCNSVMMSACQLMTLMSEPYIPTWHTNCPIVTTYTISLKARPTNYKYVNNRVPEQLHTYHDGEILIRFKPMPNIFMLKC